MEQQHLQAAALAQQAAALAQQAASDLGCGVRKELPRRKQRRRRLRRWGPRLKGRSPWRRGPKRRRRQSRPRPFAGSVGRYVQGGRGGTGK